ncbi:MAG: hypothetical protein A2W33_03695 [Chloroflexi bacterium RBG_16_52_11]|nr:MAG: hypothetical protein A2W33_03695 [Chloroflexi bacterium RBG_16_52_11]
MSLWQKLRKVLGMQGSKRAFELDQPLVEALRHLAEREHRQQDEVAVELLSAALAQRQAAEVNLRVWRSLSSRQQQVTALICLNYTNRQIAARLVVSTETVKSHVRDVLRKFNMHSKAELRQALAEWDFSEWQ